MLLFNISHCYCHYDIYCFVSFRIPFHSLLSKGSYLQLLCAVVITIVFGKVQWNKIAVHKLPKSEIISAVQNQSTPFRCSLCPRQCNRRLLRKAPQFGIGGIKNSWEVPENQQGYITLFCQRPVLPKARALLWIWGVREAGRQGTLATQMHCSCRKKSPKAIPCIPLVTGASCSDSCSQQLQVFSESSCHHFLFLFYTFKTASVQPPSMRKTWQSGSLWVKLPLVRLNKYFGYRT